MLFKRRIPTLGGRRSVAISLVLVAAAVPAFAANLTYSDGICEYRVAYSPSKVDGARLKASLDYLNDGTSPLELGPSLSNAEDIAAIDLNAYRGRCADHRRKLAGASFIEVPALEDLRKSEIDVLDEHCRMTEASLAAAKGDTKPMRAFAPACTRYTDLLDLPPATLKSRWNDLVLDLCQKSTEVPVCAGQLQRDGEGPGSEARRRIAVVTRWSECATSKRIEDAAGAGSPVDGAKQRLKAMMAKRFKAKVLSCAR